MIWSNQQDTALKLVSKWLRDKNSPQVFYLAGFAGTGKTTLAKHLANELGNTLFAAYTGKAALVLRKNGCPDACTIHSAIYYLKKENGPELIWKINRNGAAAGADLIVIDECSMVDESIGSDLLSFGKKILVLGDPAQLPPVSGSGFFTSRPPDFLLTEIHRQARDNPIIALSMKVREGDFLSVGNYGESRVLPFASLDGKQDLLDVDQVIVGRNLTRRKLNLKFKRALNKPEHFCIGDKVICLKNSKPQGLLNGSLWNIEKIHQQNDILTKMSVSSLDDPGNSYHPKVTTLHAFYKGEETELDWKYRAKFREFDYGYAITGHKAQGSQWDNITIFDESNVFREHSRRWLYTAITRAASKLTIVV